MRLTMPARTLDYLLMGVLAGIIAGVVLVYIANIGIEELARTAAIIKDAFRTA